MEAVDRKVPDSDTKVIEPRNQSERPDVLSIMAAIRNRVVAEVEGQRDKRPDAIRRQPEFQGQRKAGELLNSEELRFLNQHYSYPAEFHPEKIVSHRGGLFGKLLVYFKRKFFSFLWNGILFDYLHREKEFQANVVRYLNEVAKYVDDRGASHFWELVRKIDYDVTKVQERFDRSVDELGASLRTSERARIDELNQLTQTVATQGTKLLEQSKALQLTDSIVRGVEGLVNNLGKFRQPLERTTEVSSTEEPVSLSYLLLENRYRGSEAEIRSRLVQYADLFAGAKKPVFEVGAGRGELQILLRERGVQSFGIDLDAAMVHHARQKGVPVLFGDGLKHLRSLADNSLSGVIAIQVVEHLTHEQIVEFSTIAEQKLIPGGRVIFETINPQSLLALSSNYFRDPTHVFPQHPEQLRYTVELCGFVRSEIRYLSPVPKEAQLQEIPGAEFMTPRWLLAIEKLNDNIRRLNDLIYGCQDYALIAHKKE